MLIDEAKQQYLIFSLFTSDDIVILTDAGILNCKYYSPWCLINLCSVCVNLCHDSPESLCLCCVLEQDTLSSV